MSVLEAKHFTEFTQEVSTWHGTRAQNFQTPIPVSCQLGQYNLPSTSPPNSCLQVFIQLAAVSWQRWGGEVQEACLVVKYHLLHLWTALHQLRGAASHQFHFSKWWSKHKPNSPCVGVWSAQTYFCKTACQGSKTWSSAPLTAKVRSAGLLTHGA